MGAFDIAFDTIIVGALAVPWVLLVYHLLFPEEPIPSREYEKHPGDREHPLGVQASSPKGESPSKPEAKDTDQPKGDMNPPDRHAGYTSQTDRRVNKLLRWVEGKNQTAVAGVLLFAMTYTLGSAVSRIAQDFFDDSDFYLHVRIERLRFEDYFQLTPVTETTIRINVYCSQTQLDCLRHYRNIDDDTAKIFGLQEAAVLAQGTDKTERLRQFHNQIMVLRGAAFNGLVASFLCLFWWSARFQSRLRWIGPGYCLAAALLTSWNHSQAHRAGPPYMELTFWALGLAGLYIVRRGASVKIPQDQPGPPNERGIIRVRILILSTFLTLAAIFGWWATQSLYDQEVIYACHAVNNCPAQPIVTDLPTVAVPAVQGSSPAQPANASPK
jgi:hypothetical protein